MLCALDDVNLEVLDAPLPPDANTVYRPIHGLSGFRNDSRSWRDEFETAKNAPQEFELDLEAAVARTWASLGFPHLDDLPPDYDTADLTALSGWHIKVTFTRMSPMQVTRPVW